MDKRIRPTDAVEKNEDPVIGSSGRKDDDINGSDRGSVVKFLREHHRLHHSTCSGI
jgi:hypothetical protein